MFSGWVLGTVIFLIVVFLALGIGWSIRNRNLPPGPSEGSDRYTAPQIFSRPTAGPDPNKNTCQAYTFNGSNSNDRVIIGNPTYSSSVLSSKTGSTRLPSCVDSDQIVARQVQHTCIAPNGVVDDSIVRCTLLDGRKVPVGTKETYYSDSGCPDIPMCAGEIGLISVNYHSPSIPFIYCLKKSGTDIVLSTCDPSDESQLFRVTSTNPGTPPSFLRAGDSQSGLISSVVDRDTGLCVVPKFENGTANYDAVYLSSLASSGVCIYDGTNDSLPTSARLTLGACTGGLYPGYVWSFFPSLKIDGTPFSVPPRMVYNVGLIGPTGLPDGLTAGRDIALYLANQKTPVVYGGNVISGNGTTAYTTGAYYPYNKNCILESYSVQFLNLGAYNTQRRLQICTAEGTLGTSKCIPPAAINI